jgi:DNA repair protein RecN (Recombination protein N)
MAVVRTLDFELREGLTVLTGETGAGKSVITDSINFLVCNRISRDLIRSGENKAVVSAVFADIPTKVVKSLESIGIEIFDGEVILERSLTSDGKTVCKIDGKRVTQQMMRRVGRMLITIHGQHDSLRLSEESERITLLDGYGDCDELIAKYKEKYTEWCEVRRALTLLRRNASELSRMRDMLEFQVREIGTAKLKDGEEEALVAERTRLRSLERIKKQTDAAVRVLCVNDKGITAASLTQRATEALAKVSDVVPEFAALSARLRSCAYELEDIASELLMISEGPDFSEDPEKRLDAIEERLAQISKLKKKYGSTIAEIIEFGKNAEAQLSIATDGEGRTEELEAKEKSVRQELAVVADELTERRKSAAIRIESEVCKTLAFLDMPKVRFAVSVTRASEFSDSGIDVVSFLIAANPGEPMLPLEKTASGGELSRLMLAIKCAIAESDATGTLIFDEVDTGVSGKTSRKIGIKLKQASRTAQVLSVTHSAQIASLAHTHILVMKTEIDGRAETRLCELDESGRIEETARILGGISVTDAQKMAAVDMIAEGNLL